MSRGRIILFVIFIFLIMSLVCTSADIVKKTASHIWLYKFKFNESNIHVKVIYSYVIVYSKHHVYFFDGSGKLLWQYYIGEPISSLSVYKFDNGIVVAINCGNGNLIFLKTNFKVEKTPGFEISTCIIVLCLTVLLRRQVMR